MAYGKNSVGKVGKWGNAVVQLFYVKVS